MIDKIKFFMWRLWTGQEEGQGLIEYALIVLLIAIAVILILQAVGVQIFNVFDNIRGELEVQGTKIPLT